MNKVTLKEAYNIYNKKVKNLKNRNAYKSFMIEKYMEDEKYVNSIKNLHTNIRNAERVSGIDLLKEQLTELELEGQFFTTENSNKYPTDHVSREDRDFIIEKYSSVKSEIGYLQNLIDKKAETIYLEL
jgi:hypothetical protein